MLKMLVLLLLVLRQADIIFFRLKPVAGNAVRAGVWFTANTRTLQRVKKEEKKRTK